MNSKHPIGFHIGQLENNLGYSLPLVFPDISGGVCIVFDDESENIAGQVIESMVLEYMVQLPAGEVKIEVFDNSTRKRFQALSQLKKNSIYNLSYEDRSGFEKFEQIRALAMKRHHEILDFSQPNIVLYNALNKYREEYYFLLINFKNFPYSFQSPIALKDFFDAAWSAGIYVIAYGEKNIAQEQFETNKFLFDYLPMVEIKQHKCIIYPHDSTEKIVDLIQAGRFTIKPNIADTGVLSRTIIEQFKTDETSSDYDFLSVEIGVSSDGRTPMYFSLGKKSDVYNALITGRSGSGKSTLLNNIIVGIAQKYDASQLRLYLMDYRQGVEFKDFENHPNCEKIFLDNSDIGAAHRLIDDFISLIEERGRIFSQAGVRDIYGYNRLNHEEPMHWVVLTIDEVQRLFDGGWSDQDKFNEQIIRIVREGRGFGIHIIFSTQTLVGVSINRQIMSQITLRISLRLNSSDDAEKTFIHGNNAALKLKQFEFIYNTGGGLSDANQFGRTNSIDTDAIKPILAHIVQDRPQHLCIKPQIVSTHGTNQNQPIISASMNSTNTEPSLDSKEVEEINQKNDDYTESLEGQKKAADYWLNRANQTKGDKE